MPPIPFFLGGGGGGGGGVRCITYGTTASHVVKSLSHKEALSHKL